MVLSGVSDNLLHIQVILMLGNLFEQLDQLNKGKERFDLLHLLVFEKEKSVI